MPPKTDQPQPSPDTLQPALTSGPPYNCRRGAWDSRGISIVNRPMDSLWTTIAVVRRGLPLDRRLTKAERYFFVLADSQPTHMLTIDTKDHARGELLDVWTKRLRPRIERRRSRTTPLPYVATFPRSATHGGYHIHMLLWDWLLANTLHAQCAELGLGHPRIRTLNWAHGGHPGADGVAYVLRQEQPVFGSLHHTRHMARPKYKRWLHHPQHLKDTKPNLFRGLSAAKSASVQDKDLLAMLPMFSRDIDRDTGQPSGGPVGLG